MVVSSGCGRGGGAV